MSANTVAHSPGTARRHRLIKLPEFLALTGLSRSATYRRVRDDPSFPKPTMVGIRSVAWVESEVDSWLLSRIAQRDAKGSA